jgi:hypothetical protein
MVRSPDLDFGGGGGVINGNQIDESVPLGEQLATVLPRVPDCKLY